ncbi:MAG: hypothetical protein NTW86_11355 [Candidatus Sumerlaeota bacterium]|nr:hypothetical protein [Candidatus Sumerlaeota bacterium]
MQLTERDKRALMVLCVAAPVILIFSYVFLYGGSPLNLLSPDAKGFAEKESGLRGMYAKMSSFNRWQTELQEKQQALHVKVNPDDADSQIDAFVKAMEDLGRRSQVQILRYTQHERRTKKIGGGTVDYQTMQVDCQAQWPNLATFIKDIEAMTVPVVVDQIVFTKRTLTTGSSKSGGESRAPEGGDRGGGDQGGAPGGPAGAGGGPPGAPFPFPGGGPGGPGGKMERIVAGTLQLHVYLFPEGAKQALAPTKQALAPTKPAKDAESPEAAKTPEGRESAKQSEGASSADGHRGPRNSEGPKR